MKITIKRAALMVIMLFTLLTIFVGSGVSVNASSYIAEKQGGIFSEKT